MITLRPINSRSVTSKSICEGRPADSFGLPNGVEANQIIVCRVIEQSLHWESSFRSQKST